ncbi:hypothetical protein [Streptomyces sp. KL116D]|uniref:hypothetical protein n=1 Tax=Streptomyces sp. KL116D TaxID=3045152 RepID=UPI003556434C
MDLPLTDFALRPYARLPPHHHGRPVVSSTVDAFGRAHWLLRDRVRGGPYDALVVTVEAGGGAYETTLHNVRAGLPKLDALPDGGFVVADARDRHRTDHVQVFDAEGHCLRSFRVGDAIAHFLADEQGTLWVGYFDEGVYGDDELSHPGLRRFSATGEPLWAFTPASGTEDISDCYALNVSGTTAWACAYHDFALLEVRSGRRPWPRPNSVHGAHALAVHGATVAFFGGYGDDHDRIALCTLTWNEAQPTATGTLTRPDGGVIGKRWVVSRGARVYVQEDTRTEWSVFDLSEV